MRGANTEMEIRQTADKMNPLRKGITGSSLKIIAMVSMLLDHIGLFLLERVLIQCGLYEVADQAAADAFMQAYGGWYHAEEILRMLGRIAFPIFCFLLVQGFLHTRNLKKYLGRLLLFALISEIPFDLAVSGKLFYWEYQNIYFTLFLGILALVGIRMAEEKNSWHVVWRVLFGLLAVGLCAGVSLLMKADYYVSGVLVITVLYVLRSKKTLAMGLGCTVLMNIPTFISLLPVYLYNGQRGRNTKWLFYLFYPSHILLLYLLGCALGLGQISLV